MTLDSMETGISDVGREGHKIAYITPAQSNAAHPNVGPLAQVRAYWEGLRHGPRIPDRIAVDPRGIEGALSATFLLERVAPGIARFRIAGMDLGDLMGMEARGLPISAVFNPFCRARLAEALEQVFAQSAILSMQMAADRGFGRAELGARMLVLPLLDRNGEARLALGCLALDGKIGRAPRRFSITASGVEQTVTQPSLAYIAAARPAVAPVAVRAEGRSAAPVLRLVSSNR